MNRKLVYEVNVSGTLSELTLRQRQVLELLSHGYEYTEIAYFLQVSVNGVRAHIKNLYRKLGVNNGIQAARFYWEEQYLQQSQRQGKHIDFRSHYLQSKNQ